MHGIDFAEILIFLIVVGLVLAAPVLAIIALVRVRLLAKRTGASGIEELRTRLKALEVRLKEMEGKLAAATVAPPPPISLERSRGKPVEAAPPAVAPGSPPSFAAPPETRPAAAPPAGAAGASPAPKPSQALGPSGPSQGAGGLDLETLIAGRWLNRIGLFALFLAASFFIKLAIENDWFGPTGQVALGLVGGTVLLAFSQTLLRRGYLYFSEGFAGLGAGILYLSLWAGWDYYKLFPQAASFIGMILVTGAMMVLAVGRDSQRIAAMGLIGGFLTPMLVSTGVDRQVVLFTYLGALNTGLIALARLRHWRVLEAGAFLWTQVYLWGWYSRFYNPDKLLLTAFFFTLFFLLFAAMPVVRAWPKALSGAEGKRPQLLPEQLLLVLVNASMYLIALHTLLWEQHRWTLTVAVLALSAGHLLVARAIPLASTASGAEEKAPAREGSAARLLFAGLALTFVTLAIPIRLEGKWITLAWAVEGAVLLWSGLQAAQPYLRAAGGVLFAIVALRLLAYDISAARVVFNARFLTFAVAVACFAAALRFARERWASLGGSERNLFAVLAVAINFLALWALSLEVRDALEGGWEGRLAKQLGLSVLWAGYAALLLVLGVRRSSALLRWQALALFGVTVVKVFLYDLAELERAYRIVSFLVLGVLLVVVSFFYQRRLAAGRAAEEKP